MSRHNCGQVERGQIIKGLLAMLRSLGFILTLMEPLKNSKKKNGLSIVLEKSEITVQVK